MWSLFVLTAVVGIAMYWFFERIEGLLVAGGVLFVLIYLLIGVRLTLRQEKAELKPLLEKTLACIEEPFWVLVDGRQGTVLHVTELGALELQHDPEVLSGQRISDLTLEVSTAAQVSITEMLRFGAASLSWSGKLELKAENGDTISLDAKVLYLKNAQARKAGWVAIAPGNHAA